MVSADNLNLDVLELIFAYLSGHDLPSVALVSRSFSAAVTPKLYHTLSYHKRGLYTGRVSSPFATLLARPELAVHVRTVEIRTIPMIYNRPGLDFARECIDAVALCHNLRAFKCSVPSILHRSLDSLREKEMLSTFRAYANLAADQTDNLVRIRGLRDITLEFASWNVINILPKWFASLKKSLTSLTVFMTDGLSEDIVLSALTELHELRALHIVGCPKVDHVSILNNLVSHTPLLESLSLSTSEHPRLLCLPAHPLIYLRNLSIDARYPSSQNSFPTFLFSILSYIRSSSPELFSFSIKLPEREALVSNQFIKRLLEAYGHSLRRLAFIQCGVEIVSISDICKSCVHLRRLDLPLPIKDLSAFSMALSPSISLRVIVDTEKHVKNGIRPSLTQINALSMMAMVPNLQRIVTDGRIWSGRREPNGDVRVDLERQSMLASGALWFIPQ